MNKYFEDCEEFTARYGYSPQEYLIKVILGLIHVNPARWDLDNIDPSERAQNEAGDATRKAAALAFLAGDLKLTGGTPDDPDTLIPYMGGVSGEIIRRCDWDVEQIRAAVAARV